MNFKLTTFLGVPLRLNLFTLLFVAYLYFSTPSQQVIDGMVIPHLDILAAGGFCIMLFFVILHEYGHCWMAQKVGWKVYDVTIYPIGGIASMDFKYSNPIQEILVIVAGPAVNLILAGIFSVCLISSYLINKDAIIPIIVFFMLMVMNLFIMGFNLLPIYPMDGGRILRALLAFKLGHRKATWWAVKTGQCLGVGLIILAFCFSYYITGIILGFILIQSQAEISDSNIIVGLQNIRINTAKILDKPELAKATLPELISALEAVKDEETKEKIPLDELLPLLKDLQADGITI
jgi:Zn-dependent protease